MSAEELAKGMQAIDDPEIRGKVAGGDISAAGDFDLTNEEANLLRNAADDYPDVVGFSFDTFACKTDKGSIPTLGEVSPAYNQAVQYIKIDY